MDKPGFSSTLWVTAAIFSPVLERLGRILFFTSLICPNIFFNKFCIAVRQNTLRQTKNLRIFRSNFAKLSLFLLMISVIWMRCWSLYRLVFINGVVSACQIWKNYCFKNDIYQTSELFKITQNKDQRKSSFLPWKWRKKACMRLMKHNLWFWDMKRMRYQDTSFNNPNILIIRELFRMFVVNENLRIDVIHHSAIIWALLLSFSIQVGFST